MLPESIEISVFDGARPCPGALVRVELLVSRKNNFNNAWGPTNDHGKLTVNWQGLIEEGEKDAKAFIMDYGHPEGDFSGTIRIRVMKKEAILRAVKAYAEFSPYFTYRPGHEAMLKTGLACWDSGAIVAPSVTAQSSDPTVALICEK